MENLETIYEADRLENKFFWQMHGFKPIVFQHYYYKYHNLSLRSNSLMGLNQLIVFQ